jgi:hypothetical protein
MTRRQVQKAWCEVPAWWIPVWIALPSAAEVIDPLEEAAHELIKVGRGSPAEIADLLCLDVTLVESAVALLQQRGVIQLEDGRWRSIETPPPNARPVERAGWIAWDDQAQRPLLEVWLSKPPAPGVDAAPKGWTFVPLDSFAPNVERPSGKAVSEALRALSRLPDILAYQSFGDGWRAVDLGTNRRIRINPMRRWWLRTVHVPVEFRATGPTVWRPSLVPVPTVRTELDPTAWDGLTVRVGKGPLRELEKRRLDATNILQPLLAQHGFDNLDDLSDFARREARRDLLGSWDLPGWGQLQQEVVNAVIDGRVAAITAPQRGWRQALHGWCDVLDRATAAIVECIGLTGEVFLKVRTLSRDERRSAVDRQRVLGPSLKHLRDVVANDDQLRALENKLGRSPTIGDRVLAIAFGYAFHESSRAALGPALLECRSLFDELNKAIAVRNEIIHPREQAFELIDASTYRDRITSIVRATMRIPRNSETV